MKPINVTVKPFDKYGGKHWVMVDLGKHSGGKWVPSFHDLCRIIKALCYCEDEKYPNGKGREMVKEFLVDCCNPLMEWGELQAQYKIPDRSKHG